MRLTPRRILLHTHHCSGDARVTVVAALVVWASRSLRGSPDSRNLKLTHYPRLGQVDSSPAYRPLLVAHSTDALDAACFRLRLYCGWIAQTGVASSHLLSVNWRTADPSARMTNNSP